MLPRANWPQFRPWLSHVLLRKTPLWQGQLIGVTCALMAALARAGLSPLVEGGFPLVTFFPAVLIASLLAGPLAGLTTLILSSVIASYVWLDPTMSFNLEPTSWLRFLGFWLLGGSLIIIATLVRALMRALVESEQRAVMLAHEMTHRARNVLGLVHAISRQTSQSAATLADFRVLFEARLVVLGRAQELAIESPNVPADFKTLIERVLEPFDLARFSLTGPPAGMPHAIISTLALLIHELGTNSLKYGALSVPDGRITLTWAQQQEQVQLDWQEANGPKVLPPARNGFGSQLMKTAFPPGRGEVTIAYHPQGVHCRIVFPAA